MSKMTAHRPDLRNLPAALLLILCVLSMGWSQPQSPYRRAIEVALEAKQIDGDETVQVPLLLPGLASKDASDVRVVAEDGTLVPMTIVRDGRTDDRVILVFNPAKNKSKYFAYWGGKDPGKPAPLATITSGLLVETKRAPDGPTDSIKQLQARYDRAGEVLGRGMIDRLFVGHQPAGIDGATISKVTGTLFAPMDGEYQFALSADDRGGIRLDGKDLVFAPGFPEDIRFNTKITLKRGLHAVEYFHLDTGGDWRVSLGWRRPDTSRVDPISPDAFGRFARAKVGVLEQQKSPVSADFEASWMGECIVDERSTYRLRFDAIYPLKSTNIRANWSFGDGQSASGTKVEHVFLSPGVYEITLDLKTTQGGDKRTFRLDIGRDPNRIIEPAMDAPNQQTQIIATYDYSALEPMSQSVATRILARGKAHDAMLESLKAMLATRRHPDQRWAVDALTEAIDAALDAKRVDDLAKALDSLTPASNLHPRAADLHAGVLLWRVADFKHAEAMLSAFKDRRSDNLKRLHMQALVLNGNPDAAKKILADLPPQDDLGKRAALSGALARAIEYYIDNNELDSADEKWDDWQRRYPESFWEGYSVVLKVRMLESRYAPQAARIAEAFAKSVPDSPYAPQLLDRASRLLAKSDKTKSDAIRKLLKEKYPEDPLSQ